MPKIKEIGHRKRGKWGRLVVDWNVSLKRSLSAGLSINDQLRARDTAFLRALEGKPVPPWARINSVGWTNPDAGEAGKRKEDTTPGFLTSPKGLTTLNRGGWLAAKLRLQLASLGGEIDLEKPTGKRQKKPKRKAPRKGKKLGHLGRKVSGSKKRRRKAPGIPQVGSHRRAT